MSNNRDEFVLEPFVGPEFSPDHSRDKKQNEEKQCRKEHDAEEIGEDAIAVIDDYFEIHGIAKPNCSIGLQGAPVRIFHCLGWTFCYNTCRLF